MTWHGFFFILSIFLSCFFSRVFVWCCLRKCAAKSFSIKHTTASDDDFDGMDQFELTEKICLTISHRKNGHLHEATCVPQVAHYFPNSYRIYLLVVSPDLNFLCESVAFSHTSYKFVFFICIARRDTYHRPINLPQCICSRITDTYNAFVWRSFDCCCCCWWWCSNKQLMRSQSCCS